MNKAYILSGSLFGDEGKGSFVDYLANSLGITKNIRYNGGSQASHTVILDDYIHKFSQLGSTMFIENNQTYLSENTIVNPFSLVEEARVFADKTGTNLNEIINRVYISSKSKIVTPYHMLTNQVRELSANYEQRGSVGTGVSEVINVLKDIEVCLYMEDLLNGNYIDKLDELYFYTKDFVKENLPTISINEVKHINKNDIHNLTAKDNRAYVRDCYKNLLNSISFNTLNTVTKFHENNENIIFEGSQGLLIDKEYGIKPNTTLLDTTNHYGVKLARELKLEEVRIGIIKAFTSRHGLGVLPTYDKYLSTCIYDTNQENGYFQGRDPIYGWLDLVLLRYSQMISNNDEYFISCLDELRQFDYLKLCNSYKYNGTINEEFENIFEYQVIKGEIIIKNILKNSPRLKDYLNNCSPIYHELPGFKDNDYEEYLKAIEEFAGINITLYSEGPKRKDKVRRWKK